jgi:predicted nuclease of predicted toxin-antitoxin system
VTSVLEMMPGAADEVVIALAEREGRVLITEDRDFGQLFYAATRPRCGVILIRYPSAARGAMFTTVATIAEERGADLRDRFVVIEPGRVRVGRLP